MDPRRFPSVVRYLERVAGGLEAYPECMGKASLYRDALENCPLLDVAHELAPPLRRLIEAPLPVSEWLPEVQLQALMQVTRDVHFATADGEARYLAWVHDRNRRLLQTPLYKVLFWVVSPERLLSGVEKRWEAFHRGSPLQCLEHSKGMARLRLSYRPQLFDPWMLNGVAVAFRASVEAAHGKDVRVEAEPPQATHADFVLRWC